MRTTGFTWLAFALLAGCSPKPEPVVRADVNAVSVDVGPSPLRRLTQAQYHNTVRDLLGPEVKVTARLEPDVVVEGFATLGSSFAAISPLGVERYETAALDVVEQLIAQPSILARHIPCSPTGVSDAGCMRSFVREFGKRAWRRPLTTEEEYRLTTVGLDAALSAGTFDEGAGDVVAAMLQSPHFLFRAELGTAEIFDVWEMASRLSYFLTNSMPDDELFAAAEEGVLVTREQLRTQAARLIEKPDARAAVGNFFTELFKLGQLDALVKDPGVFEGMYPELGPDAREETLRLIEYLVFEANADYRSFFTTQETFVNERLASLYALEAMDVEGFAKVTLPKTLGRRGLLGHAAFLALQSHPVSSSAVLRGRYVRQTLLCGEIPSPPSDLNTAVPEASASAPTLRERLSNHLTEPVCAACHAKMDPIGLGFETFDGVGQSRTLDNGVEIDPSGELDGKTFANAWDLAGVVSRHPDLGACLARNVYRYATGHVEGTGELLFVQELSAYFAQSGYSVKNLFVEVAASDAFRTSGVNP